MLGIDTYQVSRNKYSKQQLYVIKTIVIKAFQNYINKINMLIGWCGKR